MKKDSIEEQASLYVLDLLPDEERDAFETLLAGSPDIKQLVSELRRGLYNPVAASDEPVRMDLLAGVHDRLALDWRKDSPPEQAAVSPKFSWSRIWAVAAILLLGLNLLLLFRTTNEDTTGGMDLANGAGGNGTVADGETVEGLAALDNGKLLAQIERLQSVLSQTREDLEAKEKYLTNLASENREIRSYNAGWQREYTRLAAKFLPFFESNDGLSRFTVIEMMDEASIAAGFEGRGFAELAGSFLIGEENIAGVGELASVGPVAAGAGVQTLADVYGTPGLAPALRDELANLNGVFVPNQGEADHLDLNIVPGNSTDSPTLVQDGSPAGFTVWRDDEQKGFLDLYNLPETSSGESAFLWVRASELEPYIPVGFLPEMENGTGSVFYEVDEPNFTPAEILVTSEQEDVIGNAPSGTVLLRGP